MLGLFDSFTARPCILLSETWFLHGNQDRLVQINTRTVFGDVNASNFQADAQQ
jgi:hypothetical protein